MSNTTAIYYDLDDVPSHVIARARKQSGAFEEFIPRGALWGGEGGLPHELSNTREFDYQQSLMDWIDRLFESLENSAARDVLTSFGQISLLELIRYKYFFAIAEWHQRLMVLTALGASSGRPVCWVGSPKICRSLSKLTTGVPQWQVRLLPVESSSSLPRRCWDRMVHLARRLGDRAIERWERWTRRTPRLEQPNRSERVVFVEYFPNSAKVLLSVAKALESEHGLKPVWLAARRQVQQQLKRFGRESFAIEQLVSRANGRRQGLDHESRSKLRSAVDTLPADLFDELGGLAGKQFLSPAIYEQCLDPIDEAMVWLDTFHESFAELEPTCVVSTTYSSIVGRAAAAMANRHGARSVFVQHGMFPDCDFFAHFCNDRLLLWGDANKRTIARNGFDESRIEVVGAPIYDDLIKRTERLKDRAASPSGKQLKIAYLASRTAGLVVNYAAAKRYLLAVVHAVAQLENAVLVVKVHPGDKTGMVPSVLADFADVVVVQQGNSQDVICDADVVLVVSSTTGLEACVADKPLIVLKTRGVAEFGPYVDYGAAVHVSLDDPQAHETLANAIRSLATDAQQQSSLAAGRRRLVEDLLNGGLGNATTLTARAIARFAASKNVEQHAGSAS